MSRRVQTYIFAALIVVLGFVLYRAIYPASNGVPGVVAADAKFQPLDIQEPELHLDLLDNIRKTEYSGTHRNIFVAEPIPPPQPKFQTAKSQQGRVGPRVPPPPLPLQVPVQFFGYASEPSSGRRVGFFASGDDVLVLAQGDTFLDRYRLLSLTNSSAEVMEISSGRRATLPIAQPPAQVTN
ncbi:MAG: hypothetical protein ACRD4X_14600 [Candidatus Acidiferrales bacterium]